MKSKLHPTRWELTRPGGMLKAWLLVFCTLAASFTPSTAIAATEGTGTIVGTVLDESQGKYLEGAEIIVDGTNHSTNSQRSGDFELNNVPAGTHTVTISYPGLEPTSESVTVTAGQTSTLAVKLASDIYNLGELVITSSREGMSQAVALQKVSIQAKLIAAADQFGEISEGNVGEYLKYLPGVGIDYNANDARGVSLRGLNTSFTVVTVDGTPMAASSSTDDTRRFEFEQIAMNNVETTEVFKTVTPDIPANATGGFINFVTKSAFDRQDTQTFSYNVSLVVPSTNVSFGKEGGVWGNKEEFTIRPNLEFNFARRISDKIGFNVNYRMAERYDDSPRYSLGYNTATPSSTAASLWANPRLTTYTLHTEQKLTHRESFASKLDLRLTDKTKVQLSGQWNWYDLNFHQRGPIFRFGNNATTTGGSNESTVISGTGAGVSISSNVLMRNKYGTTIHFNGTLEQELGEKSKVTVSSYYSKADGQYRDMNKGLVGSTSTLNTGIITGITMGGLFTQDLPSIALVNGTTPVSLDTVRLLSNYNLGNTGTQTNLQSRPWTTNETKTGIAADYHLDMTDAAMPFRIQAGFAIDKVERDITRLVLNGATPNLTGTALTALQDTLFTKDVGFGFGSFQVVDPYKTRDAYQQYLWRKNNDFYRDIQEDNSAFYVRSDVNVTSDLLLIGGARWEKREMSVLGTDRAVARSKRTQINLDYAKLYPSLSFKYTPSWKKALVMRGGVSRTVGHPDYAEVIPTVTSESAPALGDGSLAVPDPDLKPFFSTNFDLTADYYFKKSGVLGVALFRKNTSGFINPRNMTAGERTAIATEYGLNGAEFNSGSVFVNGADSSVTGVEVSYAQNLDFLPKPLSGINVQANFTLTDTDADDNNTLLAQMRGAAPKSFNFVLGYRLKKVSITTTTNWTDATVFSGLVNSSWQGGTSNANPLLDTTFVNFKDETTTTNIKLEYSFSQRFTAFFLVNNIFGEGRDDYMRGKLPENAQYSVRLNHYQFGEPYINVGLRGRF